MKDTFSYTGVYRTGGDEYIIICKKYIEQSVIENINRVMCVDDEFLNADKKIYENKNKCKEKQDYVYR